MVLDELMSGVSAVITEKSGTAGLTKPVLGALVWFLLASPALAQPLTKGAAVDVGVKPKLALVGQPVVISGRTGYHEKSRSVTATIKHQSGGPASTLTAQVSEQGTFTLTFPDTKKPGKYGVVVSSPDGKGEGKAEFEVTSLAELAERLDHAFRELDRVAGQLLKQAEEAARSLPASKERDEVVNRIDEILVKRRTVDLPPVEILGELRRVVQGPTVVYLPEVKVFGELQEWVGEAEETVEGAPRGGPPDLSKGSICETMNTAIEGCKFAALAFNVGKTGLVTLKKVFLDKAIPSVVSAAMGENAASAGVSSGLKTAAARLESKIGVQSSLPGLVLDLVEFGIKQLFELYCGTYQCPIQARMTMVWNEGVQPWMKYSIELEGRMNLRFPLKSAAGKPLPMTGEIEGNAVKHEFWEDAFVVEPLPKGVLLLNRIWLPPPAFANAAASPVDTGAVLRMATPASFNVPLVAEMAGDTITLRFKPARTDFSAQMTHRKLFVVFNGLMPDFTVMKVPIQSAFWIWSKGFGDSTEIEVGKDGSGKRFIAKTFTSHRETPDKGVVVDWRISFDSRRR